MLNKLISCSHNLLNSLINEILLSVDENIHQEIHNYIEYSSLVMKRQPGEIDVHNLLNSFKRTFCANDIKPLLPYLKFILLENKNNPQTIKHIDDWLAGFIYSDYIILTTRNNDVNFVYDLFNGLCDLYLQINHPPTRTLEEITKMSPRNKRYIGFLTSSCNTVFYENPFKEIERLFTSPSVLREPFRRDIIKLAVKAMLESGILVNRELFKVYSQLDNDFIKN